ncbi:hypothetical protein GF382_03515, partial [Candidatus Falkowbacteria bacterium]|nr:hypothetical protein [Candidatus Falkowbacteria bacterium]
MPKKKNTTKNSTRTRNRKTATKTGAPVPSRSTKIFNRLRGMKDITCDD